MQMANDFKIGEDGTIIRNATEIYEQTEEEKLFAEYQLLERKVLRLSGSTATPEETARYKKLKERFEEQVERSVRAFADAKEKAKAKIGAGGGSKLLAAMAAFKANSTGNQ
jgi:DNA-binding GntR family transcriptional regulator